MFETALLVAQMVAVAMPAAWMGFGVINNIMRPAINETFTAQVFRMERMREVYPDSFAEVAHRAIDDRRIHLWAFRLVVLAEAAAFVMLTLGTVALAMAIVGTGSEDTARALALIGALLFTCVWAGMLIVGEYFCYWFCHEWAQATHYKMLQWGLLVMIFLSIGAF